SAGAWYGSPGAAARPCGTRVTKAAASCKVRDRLFVTPRPLAERLMSTVVFRCRASDPATPLPHAWEHTVGSCHAPLALRADWQAQLRRCRDELGFRHVRFHGLLCDDVGTLVRHRGRLVYSFFNADSIADCLLSLGMRPFVEL